MSHMYIVHYMTLSVVLCVYSLPVYTCVLQAMKNNAVFRIWILFFLIVCTFSLLFLDWYNA